MNNHNNRTVCRGLYLYIHSSWVWGLSGLQTGPWASLSYTTRGTQLGNMRGARAPGLPLLSQKRHRKHSPRISMKRLKNRIGFREKNRAKSFLPTRKGFRSSSFKCVCTESRRSFSISLHSLSSKCYSEGMESCSGRHPLQCTYCPFLDLHSAPRRNWPTSLWFRMLNPQW